MNLSETYNSMEHSIFSGGEKTGGSSPETSDDSPVTKAKLWMISSRAHLIAYNVRYPSKQLGTIRTQGYVSLEDGRTAFLKRSQDESNRDDVLEIHIGFSSDFQYFIHAVYNLTEDDINAFDIRRLDHSPVVVYDRFNAGRCDPAGLTRSNFVKRVDEMLGMVETASEHIEEKMPASTPNSLRVI
jgi:hypothetical protein